MREPGRNYSFWAMMLLLAGIVMFGFACAHYYIARQPSSKILPIKEWDDNIKWSPPADDARIETDVL